MRHLLILLFIIPFISHAQTFQSGSTRTELVELFSSEGCSSCPPADHWLTSLKSDPKLFKDYIPVAFHVDYWDYIGWKDRFATAEFTQRQRQYAVEGRISQMYTPEFVVNSEEWQQWFHGDRIIEPSSVKAGELTATLDKDLLNVSFSGLKKEDTILHVAYLGMGLESKVSAGENNNRTLKHDFVALNHFQIPGQSQWHIAMPERPNVGQKQTALVIWISPKGSQRVLQSVGGYLL
ncbi:DUF1223 domain-containing protein [Marinomonas sp.]|uniref:DUF1223 domain-containing protein n=1 Tax=Marinomonas sp. TaxID=1904862 RepID=UPI003BA9EB65